MQKITREHPNYGRGSHTIRDVPMEDAASVSEHLRAKFSDPAYRPPMLPSVALRVHQLARSPEASLANVAEVLETDAMLAAGVLRVARSPMYAGRSAPQTLRDAVARLGIKGISDVVFQAALTSGVFRARGLDEVMGALQRHSVVTAHLGRHLARKRDLGDHAFLFCLLHDVGMAAILVALSEMRGLRAAESLSWIREDLTDMHQEIGVLVTRAWGLPGELVEVVATHHAPTAAWPAMVRIAEHVANELGHDVCIDNRSVDRLSDAELTSALEVLRMSEKQLELFIGEGRAMLEPQ